MDIRTISGAAYSRPMAPIAGGDLSLPAESTKSADSAAPFFSPVYRFDPVAKLSILSFRDANSGAIVQQIPNEKVVEQYRRTGGENPDARPAPAVAPKEAASATAPTGEPARSVAGGGEPAATPAAAPEHTVSAPPVAAPEPTAAEAPPAQRLSLSV